jgi:hypothetical protein
MKRFTILTLAVIAASALYAQDSLADRDATAEERARVVEALTAVGCPEVGEVEFDDDGYFEAEDVKCEGSDKKYEIHLDRDMNIIKKIDDD